MALLDFHPWGDCNEAALVEDFVNTAPIPKSLPRNHKKCPISASALFNKGGPDITGAVNMKTIEEFEKHNAEAAAAKAAKRKQKKESKIKKRQGAKSQVVNMVIQELLAAKTPPETVNVTLTLRSLN